MKGSVRKENSGRNGGVMVRRGLALLFAGCVLTSALGGCGGDDKKKDESSGSSGLSSMAPISAATPTPQPMAKAIRVEVDDSLNVRQSGSTEANILGSLQNGDELALLSETEQNGWYQVSYNGGVGYVSAQYVKVIDVTAERYEQLKAATSATPTPEATTDPSATIDPNTTPDPAATPAPAGNTGTTGTTGNTGSSASSDSEDGE